MARVSVIIPVYGAFDHLDRCLKALDANTPETHELVIVDNGYGPAMPDVPGTVRLPRNRGFAIGCNVGAEYASGDVLVFLNSDTEVQPGWLPPVLAAFDARWVGVVGVKLTYPDGTPQHTGVDVDFTKPPGGEAWGTTHDRPAGPVDAVTGACMAVRRDCWEHVGGFDRGYWNGYEDVDLCIEAVSRGWEVRYQPASTVIHAESASGPERWTAVRENVQRLRDKWG